MNYDEFRDFFNLEFHGKVYSIMLNLCQYRDKDTKAICIKAEVYDEESEGLRTFCAPCTEFRFKKKEFEFKDYRKSVYLNNEKCINTCEDDTPCESFKYHISN